MESTENEIIENDLIMFIQFYFAIAKENLENLFDNKNPDKILEINSSLNFWQNFALNFKDPSFIQILLMKNNEKIEYSNKILSDIINLFINFLEKNFSDIENSHKITNQKIDNLFELIIRISEILDNIQESYLNLLIKKDYKIYLKKFSDIYQIDINILKNVFYEKIGYSYLDFNGNFLWADEYSKEVLFEEKDITKINLFEIMSKFSKYVLKKKYGDKFFDFKDENNRIRVFTYTIEKKFESKEKILDNFFEVLNSNKTLVSRASAVLLQNYGDNGTNPCILLETKYSILRQNYDYFLWKKYIN
jgi:hypothetical protein